MSDEGPLRLLGLVRQRLSAQDARIEIGGQSPTDPRVVWTALGRHRRVVALFDEPPPAEAQNQLAELVEAFASTADAPKSDGPAALATRTLPTEIDAELNGLAMRAKAVCAVLVDASSPVVWGRSHGEISGQIAPLIGLAEEVDAPAKTLADRSSWPQSLQRAVGKDTAAARRLLMAALGIRAARNEVADDPTSIGTVHRTLRQGDFAFMVRSLAGVYLLILGFEGGFSEPQAEGVLQRGHSEIERLIVSLPPTDPPPKPGRVLSLHRPKS